MKTTLLVFLLVVASLRAEESTFVAANAINSFGLDLLHAAKSTNNFLISPYSIQSALAMTYAGADGVTHDEMAKALHFPAEETELHQSFKELRTIFNEAQARSLKSPFKSPLTLTTANRLFGQKDYSFFLSDFLTVTKESYGAALLPVDFKRNPVGATREINQWVEEQTQQRIKNVIPDGSLDKLTRLVLVNAIYFKAPWTDIGFPTNATEPEPFQIASSKSEMVATMRRQDKFGYLAGAGFRAISVPYREGDLQFLILLPDAADGLIALEARMTPDWFTEFANLKAREIILHLPKFKMEPPGVPLSAELKTLGMKTAFDPNLANFNRMAVPQPDGGLYVSEVFHKAFLALDEKGTEAAAATLAVPATVGIHPKPIEVKVDHPFVFAIQHRPSGACLFLGHVTDPR
jgi:serpin B